jgi:hypothetical protein
MNVEQTPSVAFVQHGVLRCKTPPKAFDTPASMPEERKK